MRDRIISAVEVLKDCGENKFMSLLKVNLYPKTYFRGSAFKMGEEDYQTILQFRESK